MNEHIVKDFVINRIDQQPELLDTAAQWFHEKWGIPLEAYRDSMEESLENEGPVPSWYIMRDGDMIIAGMGVIENDFHDRPDLRPNVCAVFTEEDYRHQRLAGKLLDHICQDMHTRGIDTLYLVTDHEGLYERYGWQFFVTVQGDGEEHKSRLYVHHMDQ